MKKKILFFVRNGQPSDVHKAAADAIAAKHEATVPFRNADFAGQDFVEDCHAVAGSVPKDYAAKFPRVSVKEPFAIGPKPGGEEAAPALVDKQEAPEPGAPVVLPPNLPTDKEGLRKLLDAHGVSFHPNQGVPALTKLAVQAIADADKTAQ